MAELNLEPFVLKIDQNKRNPVVRLSFTKLPHIWFNGPATQIVRESIGEQVDVSIDPDTKRIALTEGDMRKLSCERVTDEGRRIFISRFIDEIAEIYGECKRVYFDIDVYENAILLTPNGRVVK
ncbi:MAG: hypothetical protein IKG11_03130 [Atopobiaceae bacterium]|nr:hypothetical protein [Atopobiaceae bacterium]